MHCQNKGLYTKYQACRAYEIAQELKAEGKVKYVGFSFHDDAEFLDKILCDHPEIDVGKTMPGEQSETGRPDFALALFMVDRFRHGCRFVPADSISYQNE
jgi:hypothetical protein